MSKISTQIFLQKLNSNQLVVDNYFAQKPSQLVDNQYICIIASGSLNPKFIVLFHVLKSCSQHQF